MIVTAFVVIWLLVLIPLALRKHSEHRLVSSVARFRHQRQLLERAYASHPNNRDSVSLGLVGPVGPAPDAKLRRSIDARVAIRQRRRRLSLGVLGTVFFLTLMIGFVPALRAFWAVAIVSAVLMATYLVLLARCVASEAKGVLTRDAVGATIDGASILWPDHHPAASISDETDSPSLTYLPSRVRLLVEERSA